MDEGREAVGRSTLGSSIEKAEGIVEESPDSRWADDAWRLIARARLLRLEWNEAAEASRSLMRYAQTGKDSAEAAGYLGSAELNLGNPAFADSLLSVALAEERDEDRRAQFLHGRARARAQLGHLDEANEDLLLVSALRPDWITPRIDRVGLLVDDGRAAEAGIELAALLQLDLTGREQEAVLETAERVAERSPETALVGLADLESSGFEREVRGLLVKLRGDLRLARGDNEGARSDYEQAASLAGTTRAGIDAGLTAAQIQLRGASSLEEIVEAESLLADLELRPAGRRPDIMRLRDTLIRMEYWVTAGGLGYVIAAETARDQLEAPEFARRLFLRYADEEPDALWAAKAILAALELSDLDSAPQGDEEYGGAGGEELRRRLREDYSDSPYVLAVLGEPATDGLTYEEVELMLLRQLDRLESLAGTEVRAVRSGAERQ
jgi:tetratricopeptide (TPR) repeat protein